MKNSNWQTAIKYPLKARTKYILISKIDWELKILTSFGNQATGIMCFGILEKGVRTFELSY